MRALRTRYRRLATLTERPGRLTLTAQDRVLGGIAVLKLAAAGSSEAQALHGEAERLRRLDHPAIVGLSGRFEEVQGFEEDELVSGFAMPWAPGQGLGAARLDQPLEQRLAWFGQLVEAVAYLHRASLLHLDLKPANVLAGRAGVMVLDLGTARPTDSGPGSAGGTLGYAAPEVLRGEAADSRADVFSLGVLLYELLSGQSPFGPAQGSDLHRAVLAGDQVPLAAWGVAVDPELAELVHAMLTTSASGRPSDLQDLAGRLEALGMALPPARGEPAWVERAELEREARRRQRSVPVLTLVGPAGSGRQRLGRWLCTRRGTPGLDLGDPAELLASLARLAHLGSAEVPADPQAPGWWDQVRRGLAGLQDGPELICLGRREDHSADQLRRLDQAVAALVGTGCRVLWCARQELASGASVRVGPLRADEAAELGHWYGVSLSSRLRAAFQRSGGWIGRLCWELAPAPTSLPQLSPAARTSLDRLSLLPDGIPDAALAQLPPAATAGLDELLAAGLARAGEDHRLYLVHHAPERSAGDELRPVLAAIGRDERHDLLWRSLLLARLGLLDTVPGGLPSYREVQAERQDELHQLLTELVQAGDRTALSRLLQLTVATGDDQAVLALYDSIDDPLPLDQVARARALRRLRRLQEAADQLEALVAEPDPPVKAWVELGLVSLTRQDLDRAEQSLAAVQALEGRPTTESRILQAQIAVARHERGEPVGSLDELIDWALSQVDNELLDPVVFSSLGLVANTQGRTREGLRLQQLGARRADAEGLVVPAAGIRMNRALQLERMGRIAEARRGLEEVIRIADRARNSALGIQARYNLARLELRAGRLPAAEAWIGQYVSLVATDAHPEVRARGALNRAWLALLQQRPRDALDGLQAVAQQGVSPDALTQLQHLVAWALLDLDRPQEVLTVLDEVQGVSKDEAFRPVAISLRGRAHLAIGRQHIAEARDLLPEEPEAGMELTVGEVLLAWGGEDADPALFPQRRAALGQAARYLRGPLAAKAARLRDRLLDSPGAALDQVVALTEAMHDPQAFPAALARLVREALGAHRVLIMMRLPGLGNQLGYTELSGSQAAGIGREVMERIQRPDDVWIAGDAFADPQLRESSQTVQTFELKSLLAVAIPRGDEAVGALYVDDMHRTNRFDDEDVALLQRLARAVGAMIPLMRRQGAGQLEEPGEVLGVMLSDPVQLRELRGAVEMVAEARESNLLVTGPTGSGKSVLARRLATEVMGLNGVEVVVLRKGDPQMLVTQLMGSRRGEFTGAVEREGAVARCMRERKALFLDEIQNLDETGQQILLPLLDLPRSFGGLTGTSERLRKPLHIVLGTNHDVSGDRAFDVFRTDLWYRMSRIHMHLPALADRGSEVVYRYLARLLAERELSAPERIFETSALFQVTHAPWPGNLRQLDGFAERAAHLYQVRQHQLAVDDLSSLRVGAAPGDGGTASDSAPSSASLDDVKVRHVMSVLRRHDWVQKSAAEELGMRPPTLNKFLKRHRLLDEVRRRRQAGG